MTNRQLTWEVTEEKHKMYGYEPGTHISNKIKLESLTVAYIIEDVRNKIFPESIERFNFILIEIIEGIPISESCAVSNYIEELKQISQNRIDLKE